MALLLATPESIIEQAKYLFISENFSGAIEILRDCFEEDEVSTETILSLLKGDIGYAINGDDVNLGVDFINEDYQSEVNEILENYDFLIKKDGQNYQVDSLFNFDLSTIALTNDYIKELRSLDSILFAPSDLKYFKEINEIVEELSSYDLNEVSYMLYAENNFYIFKKYSGSNISEISTFYEPIDAAMAFQKNYNKYYC